MKTSVQFNLNESVVDLTSLSSWLMLCWQAGLYPSAHTYKMTEVEHAVELSAENPVWLRLRRVTENTVEVSCLLDPHNFEEVSPGANKDAMLARVVDELSVALSTRNDIEELIWKETFL